MHSYLQYFQTPPDDHLCWLSRWLLPSHPSVPSLIPFPHFCQTDRERSGPDSLISTSILSYSSSPKPGEIEDCLFLFELGKSGSRSVLVIDEVQLVWKKQDGAKAERQKPSAINNILDPAFLVHLLPIRPKFKISKLKLYFSLY